MRGPFLSGGSGNPGLVGLPWSESASKAGAMMRTCFCRRRPWATVIARSCGALVGSCRGLPLTLVGGIAGDWPAIPTGEGEVVST